MALQWNLDVAGVGCRRASSIMFLRWRWRHDGWATRMEIPDRPLHFAADQVREGEARGVARCLIIHGPFPFLLEGCIDLLTVWAAGARRQPWDLGPCPRPSALSNPRSKRGFLLSSVALGSNARPSPSKASRFQGEPQQRRKQRVSCPPLLAVVVNPPWKSTKIAPPIMGALHLEWLVPRPASLPSLQTRRRRRSPIVDRGLASHLSRVHVGPQCRCEKFGEGGPVLAPRVRGLGFSNPRGRIHGQEVPRGRHPEGKWETRRLRAMRGIDWEVRLMKPRALNLLSPFVTPPESVQ